MGAPAAVWPMATAQWPAESWDRSPAGLVPPPKWPEEKPPSYKGGKEKDWRERERDRERDKERERERERERDRKRSGGGGSVGPSGKGRKDKEREKEKVGFPFFFLCVFAD